MPGSEMYIPDYPEEEKSLIELTLEQLEKSEKTRIEQVRPKIMTSEEIEIFWENVPF